MKLILSLVFLFFIILIATPSSKCEQNKDGMTAYVKASVPNQIYKCIQRFNLLRCLKYFVLLRLEARDISHKSTINSTNEFLGNILKNVENLPTEFPEKLTELNDEVLNERLTREFQKFFHERPIKLHFIPSMLVKVVPSKSNDLEISLKRTVASANGASRQLEKDVKEDEEEEDDYDYDEDTKEADTSVEGTAATGNKDTINTAEKDPEGIKFDETENMKQSGMRKKRGTYLEVGLPLVLAPYMVFAGFLPMLIPVLKLATAFTTIVNVTALIASIMYLARQQALEKEMQQTVYFNPGYKERK
ncbi:hypothetical protein PVAND_001402 [Polypedilum vanderplanki]|uniref:Uncharacterized protein n=1 Tax=Polypedilum vanderplanki TaxID=319348 RepID=A0A9J6BNC8_POLVA|nr:hypothetical protein PVAND_001402 [Polypedilum vanderplanki]